jgi:hypothetical protein
MNNVVFRSPRQHPVTTADATERKVSSSIMQDPAIILLAALTISFVMLVMATTWLMIRG